MDHSVRQTQRDVAALLATAALGAWLARPGLVMGLAAAAFALVSAVLVVRAIRPLRVAAALLCLLAAVQSLATTLRINRIDRDWPVVREEMIQQASARLSTTLAGTVREARDLAAQGVATGRASAEDAFDRLAGLVRSAGPERGVVVFDSAGSPWAWAGRQRLPPAVSGRELQARITPFYVVLEARRQTRGVSAVGHVVLSADSAITDAEQTVAARFARDNSVHLAFLAPRSAPAANDVFDYCIPACGEAGADTLFSVRTVAPAPQDEAQAELVDGGRWVAWLALVALVLVSVGGGAAARYGALAVTLLLGVFTPLPDRLGLHALFSRETFGPLSSAGTVMLAGALVVAAVVMLRVDWAGRGPGRSARVLAGVAAVFAASVLLGVAQRGIHVPADGAGVSLWLVWQTTLALAAGALLVVAAALIAPARGREWMAWAAVALAAGAAFWRAAYWDPAHAAAPALDVVWLVAFAGALFPGHWRRRVVTIGLVAGAAAATKTWDAVQLQRVRLAEKDAARLGPGGGDPVVGSLLDRFGAELGAGAPPRSDAELYAKWARSPLAADRYPVDLVTWSPEGTMTGQLRLAELDLPPALLKVLASNARISRAVLVEPLNLVPGLHYVLAVPYGDGEVVTVGVGPRSRLIATASPGELLRGPDLSAPFEMSLTVPQGGDVTSELRWRRDAWTVRGEQRLDFPGGTRHLHVVIDLGGQLSVIERGVLMMLLDALLLSVLWAAAAWWAGRPPAMALRLGGRLSYRAQLTTVLALFFVVPMVGFAIWAGGRARAEARAARDLSIGQTLRDASRSASGFLREPADRADRDLDELAGRFGTDLDLYEGGFLNQTSADVLAQLGLIDYYLPPAAWRALALEDRIRISADAERAGRPVRVGYQTLAELPDGPAVLAVARPAWDSGGAPDSDDALYGLVLATLVGLAGAWGFATLTARALAQPVHVLREAAERVGRGEPVAPLASGMPVEFLPLADAVGRMAQAVRVLAWGELARQIAHEIKNPLTPIRLGVQHLVRSRKDPRGDFDQQLDKTSKQILGEIERLDAIARAFARFGAPQAEAGPLESVDALVVARDTAQLYALGGSVAVSVSGAATVLARKDELREVLINLIENARDADAKEVTIRLAAGEIAVMDNGRGIPPEHVPRIFEPQFSTTTSGTGLGLAICRRLVEGWGAGISVESATGKGTTVRLMFRHGGGA